MTSTTTTTNTVKIRYLRDPEDPRRVLTIATKLEGDKVSFAWSMNSPNSDRFARRLGSKIALGRLSSKHAVCVPLMEGVHPYVVVLCELMARSSPTAAEYEHLGLEYLGVPRTAGRIARDAWTRFQAQLQRAQDRSEGAVTGVAQ